MCLFLIEIGTVSARALRDQTNSALGVHGSLDHAHLLRSASFGVSGAFERLEIQRKEISDNIFRPMSECQCQEI